MESQVYCIGIRAEQVAAVVTWGSGRRLEPKEISDIELPDGSAPELKGYISRCEMFIGARTHATIAAYSSCVPTLVVGYSIKARGIAKDLFGTDEGYVLPVQALAQKEDLVNAFDWLYQNAQAQKAHLQQIMPDYCKKAKEAENLLREL